MGKEITVDDRRQERDHLEIDYSGPQLPTTTQKIIVKMEFDEIRESRRIRKWKEGFGEETETSRGGFLIDSESEYRTV